MLEGVTPFEENYSPSPKNRRGGQGGEVIFSTHSFAISFLRNGANPFELQIALGHTTLEMTRRYTQALGFDDVFKRHVMASPVDRL
jgi:hypothetical protein